MCDTSIVQENDPLPSNTRCESPTGWNLPEIQNGLMSSPRYVPEQLQWITQEGQDLYTKRKTTIDDFYKKEVTSLTMATNDIARKLANNVVIIDLGAGLSNKTTSMFNCLIKGFPDRRICYIPVDLNEIIMDWFSHLKSEHPDINEHIVHIKPVIMDMLEAVQDTDTLLKGTGCEDWEVVYSLFGPMCSILKNTYFTSLINAVNMILPPRGSGGFLFSYIPSHDEIEARMNKEFFSKVDSPASMKCVLLGLNKVVGASIDPDKFEYEKTFIDNNRTPGVDGKWSGFVFKAKAKEDMQVCCKKLNMMLPLKQGQQIRLSEDTVRSHYYEDTYIRSLAETTGLTVQDIWQEPSELISCVYMSI